MNMLLSVLITQVKIKRENIKKMFQGLVTVSFPCPQTESRNLLLNLSFEFITLWIKYIVSEN